MVLATDFFINLIDWGWKVNNGKLQPITMNNMGAPAYLLKHNKMLVQG